MKTTGWLLTAIVTSATAGFGGYWYGQQHHHEAESTTEPSTQPADEEKPVVTVEVVPLKKSTITETTTAYGTVVMQSGDVKALSVPFESRVTRVFTTPGESVETGVEIVRVEASPDASVALQEARNALDAASRDLKQVEQRLAEHLSTNQELSLAQQTAASAKLKLDNLVARGVGEAHTLKAESPGIVSKVDVQNGQVVPAGASLVELAAGNRIEVRLGVEPADALRLKVGQTIPLRTSAAADPIDGVVRLVERRVDPATRLVGVIVTLPPDTHLILETFLTGEIVKNSAEALVVPRNAALPDDEGKYILYTVKDAHAVRHDVQVGLQNGQEIQVTAEDLHEGDPVVIVGNNLLADHTEVDASEVKEEPTSRPTTAQAEAKQ